MIKNIKAETTASPGYPFQTSCSILNQGNLTSGLISVRLLLFENISDSPLLASGNTEENMIFMEKNRTSKVIYHIATATGDPLKPSEMRTISNKCTIPEELPQGFYDLYAELSDSSRIDTNLTGNRARITTPINVSIRALPDPDKMAQEIKTYLYLMTEKMRLSEGLNILKRDDALEVIAQDYAEKIAETGKFSHYDSNGEDASARAKNAGYPTIREIEGGRRIGIGENLAYMGTGTVSGVGYVDPTDPKSISEAIMNGWMKSPGHRKNILDPLGEKIGIGTMWNGEYWYGVQNFF